MAENVEPCNSFAPHTRAAILLGSSGNLSGGQIFFALDTGHTIARYQWVVLPMPPAVIARVTLIGKAEPSTLTFTDQQGREIGDHQQDFDSVGDDDDGSDVEFILDVIPGVDHAPEDDAELPGVDTDFDAKPTGVEVDSNYAARELNKVMMTSSNNIHTQSPQSNQAPNQLLCQVKTLHCLAKEWQHRTLGQGKLLRSTSQP